ncbi:MAG: bifunctional oligoribonuclease/PAP phosphatase NrnA [Marinilabiliales bacterium]|nr:MAG: bifunctional oligoribonuclease/PAP phosphatase NrnA [Marinilabiliales bacterium]
MTDLADKVESILKSSKNIVILSHVNPDGDAVGSSLALCQVLINTGKINTSVVMPNEYPDFLKWLPGTGHISIMSKESKKAIMAIEEADMLFMLDFNSPDRAGEAQTHINASKACKVLIDHHPDPGHFADITISDTRSSSTAELVYRLIEMTGKLKYIDNNVATCIYAGIMSDTGSFSYNSSEPETYRVLSELLRLGVDKDKIFSRVYDNFSENRMRLLGFCLDKKMVVLPKFRAAYMSLSLSEKRMYKYVRGDAEGFVNYPLSIKGISFAAFFMENDGHVKISFRSKDHFDASKFALENFNGGGHKNASGGESELGLQDTINKFISLLPSYIKTE